MDDLFFDRVLAIGSGVLGILLLAGAAMQLRAPLSGAVVAGAPQPSFAAASDAPRAVTVRAAPQRPRVRIVAWPYEASTAAPARRFVERRSTRIVPSPIRIEHRPEPPSTRVASRAAPVPVKAALRVVEHVRTRHTDPDVHAAAKKESVVAKKRPAGAEKRVALRVAAKPKARLRKRLVVAPLPEPPVGYDPKINVVPPAIEDATTASSIAADPSDADRPSVIVLRRGR